MFVAAISVFKLAHLANSAGIFLKFFPNLVIIGRDALFLILFRNVTPVLSKAKGRI